jgi:hypothetical protein
VTTEKGLLPGSYATTKEDGNNVKTGAEAVARYALEGLPNQVMAASYHDVLPDAAAIVERLEQTTRLLLARGSDAPQDSLTPSHPPPVLNDFVDGLAHARSC